ncbi:MAG: sulfatase [Deltaproteobacteria bacterium]|nr:sulfatase [Deltaproteobacteria bacterium]
MRRIVDSPWLFFILAAALLVAAAVSQFRVYTPEERALGSAEDIARIRARDDVNVIFILVDTLRADRVGAYGYPRPTTPILDSHASKGIRFAKVESQSSWTKASMASLWTGMYPQRTGVMNYSHAIPEEAVLPAELFQQAGFRTAGIWRNGWVANNFGFDQGFDLYIRPTPIRRPGVQRKTPSSHALMGTDADATESAIEFIEAYQRERFFLYIHYMDVHQYLYADTSPDFGSTFSDFYDSAIHWTDRNIGFIMDALEERDLRNRTIVVIASDHGEAFFEHGGEGHARTLYREVQQVPLVVLLPFDLAPGIVVEETVANVDIWPTVLDLVGLPSLEGAEGRSLVPLVERAGGHTVRAAEAEQLAERPVFSQLDRSWGRMGDEPKPVVAMVKGPYRYIEWHFGASPPKLFDHDADPLEKNDLAEEQPDLVAALARDIEFFLSEENTTWGGPKEVEIDEMRMHQLRALGYVIEDRRELRERERERSAEESPDGSTAQ